MEKQDFINMGIALENIPKEMYWAYEAVRRSGLYDMACFHPSLGRYAERNVDEVLQLMDEVYIKFCAYTNADISKPEYKHITTAHVRFMQHIYGQLLEYYDPMPEGVVNIKKETKVTFSF